MRDQGLENICNGLGPLNPPSCRGKVSKAGGCFDACQSSFAGWSRAGADPAQLGDFMCAIGLGGDNCSAPHVRLQPAPRQEWFVSETAVHVADQNHAYPPGWLATQPAQIDATTIPYIVIPGTLRGMPWDATPGDAGVIIEAASGRKAAFVIGDTGGALGEASTKALAVLSGGTEPRKTPRTNALGTRVDSYSAGSSGDFRVAIFRHTSRHVAGASTLLTLTASELGPWIEDTAQKKLDAIGGAARILACTAP